MPCAIDKMTCSLAKIPPELITLDYHLKHPKVSLKKYFRTKALQTADRVLARKIVYLDTRYWLLLRDACLGRSTDLASHNILSTLRQLVAGGKIVCPLNADTLMELLKQRDETTRIATAELIDELSLGAALQSEEERVGTELMHCVQLTQRGSAALEPLERLVWTSPAYVLGYVFPTFEPLPGDQMLACQKAFTDYFWDLAVADQMSILPMLPKHVSGDSAAIADRLNRDIKAHDLGVRSLKDLHLDEFKGALESYLLTLAKIFNNLFGKGTGVAASAESDGDCEDAGRKLIGLLCEAFSKGTLDKQIPSLVIKSGLYAGVRRNRGRQLKANDFHDFGHATAAVAYCDYFATEKSLHHLIVSDLKFDERYEVVVVWKTSDFLRLLEQI